MILQWWIHSGRFSILIDKSVYDSKVIDDSLTEQAFNYTVIKGKVTYGDERIAVMPLFSGEIKIACEKFVYASVANNILGTTIVDSLGNYELKIPYRLLYPSATVSPPSLQTMIPMVRVYVNSPEGGMTMSPYFSPDQNNVELDLHIENTIVAPFEVLFSLYGFYASTLQRITGLTPDMFRTITNAESSPKINLLSVSYGLDAKEVQNIISASQMLFDAGVNMNDGFALIRANEESMEVLTALSSARITADLNYAVLNGIIGNIENLSGTITSLENKKIAIAGSAKTEDNNTIEQLLRGIVDTDATVKEFMKINLDCAEESVEVFWNEVDSSLGLTTSTRFQKGLQLLGITGMQLEMTKALLTSIGTGSLPDFLAAKSEGEWLSYVTTVCDANTKLCVPVSIKGSATDYHDTVIKTAYAKKLYDLSTHTFATTVFKLRLGSDETFAARFQNPTGMVAYLNANTDYDLRAQNAWATDFSNALVKKDMQSLQNLTRLTEGKPDTVIALIKNDIRSSSQIAAMSASAFSATYSSAIFDVTLANKIYTKAVHTDMILKQAYTQVMPGTYVERVTKDFSKDIWVDTTSSPPSNPTSPDLKTLFGSMDFCACADCTSMYSPAAYFTDIMNFLKTRLGNTVAYDEMDRRRPDLKHIDLTCKNSNTPLPYIDLVNELLELIILRYMKVGDPSLIVPNSFQTSGLAKDLEAYPEHTYKLTDGTYATYTDYTKVYDLILNQAIYPNTLPFNLALEESRIYFRHLGYSRFVLMDSYRPIDYLTNTDATLISEYNMLAEWLGLSRIEADIITRTSSPAIDDWKFYGFAVEGVWWSDLCNDLVLLLKRCNITYKELLQVLVTDYLNKEVETPLIRPLAIVSKSGKPVDSCQIEDLMLGYQTWVSPPGDGSVAKKKFFRRLHRFIRLQRATGWSIYQLDIVLTALGAVDATDDISVATFKYLATLHQWCERLDATPEKVCTLISNISTKYYINFDSETQDNFPSLYDSFFKNKSVINPTDPNFAVPTAITGNVEANTASILAAFGISNDDLSVASNFTPTASVDLALLSKVFSLDLATSASGLDSFQAFYDLLGLWALPLATGTLDQKMAAWKAIFKAVDKTKESPFNLYELIYVLRHLDPNNAYIPTTVTIQPFYENLRLVLRNQYDGSNSTYNADLLKQIVYQQFSANFNLEYDIAAYLLDEVIFIGVTTTKLLDILINLNFIKSVNSIIPGNTVPSLIDFTELYKDYYLMDKITLIVKKLTLSKDELKTIQVNNASLKTADLKLIPTAVTAGTFTYTDNFFHLPEWIKVRDILQFTKPEFVLVLLYSIGKDAAGATVTKTNWITLVTGLTQWPIQDIQFLAGASNTDDGILKTHFDAVTANSNDFRNGSVLMQLVAIMGSSRIMGLKPKIVYAALRPNLLVAQSLMIRKAAKAKYNDEEWLKIAKPLQDQLRIKQRDALVAYILANPTIIAGNNMVLKTANDLFAYLLIDVEMQPCMKTSRIKQGINSLQLFIDRIILNIERVNGSTTVISMSAILMEQWQTWRKWYRVWEANRKIFLYPENWIEPELRDDKTILFKAMETQLLQDDVTALSVESAYRAYLEGLDEISRLEPVTSYHDLSNGNDIIHVLARTNMAPQRYYYRRQETNEWTSWERINVDVKGDHISMVMWNNRLYIFWLTFQKENLSDEEVSAAKKAARFTTQKEWIEAVAANPDENSAFAKWSIHLNWTSYLNGKWEKSDLSKDTMAIDVSKILLNNNATQSYSNTAYTQSVLKVLTKRGEIKNDDLFKNRIYLYTSFESANAADGITFNLVFPGGLDEKGDGLHTFLWKGDNSRDPYVLRDGDRGSQIIAPLGTRFNKMKFEEDTTQDGRFRKDGYVTTTDGYYSYSDGRYISNVIRSKRSTSSPVILNATPFNQYRITARADNASGKGLNPLTDHFFFEDEKNTYLVKLESPFTVVTANVTGILNRRKTSVASVTGFTLANYNVSTQAIPATAQQTAYLSPLANVLSVDSFHFYTFYHPQSPRFIGALNSGGVASLLTLANQSQVDSMGFSSNYQPTSMVTNIYPANNVQFGFSDPYSIYNWELFFHTPMLIAQGLMNNQQFEESQKWLHYVFNPTSNTNINGSVINTNQRFWKFYPFYEYAATPAQTLNQLLIDINNNVTSAVAQVRKWENNPFKPHVIARMRILAYMKYVLMKYLDNLIAWGDQLFRRDTIESINEATQLYILAANILGDRPTKIPPRVKKKNYTFAELIANGPLDALSNAMVAIESFYAPNAAPGGTGYQAATAKDGRDPMNLTTLYFCLPPNAKLLAYWDTIADRLFKIRNCMTIDGVTRELPLYEPPIDPALLVRATAMGVNINTILDNLSGVNVPLYRFTYMAQKTNEVIADVKNLGSALLSAVEKKDAEALALLRSSQEMHLLDRITYIKQKQISEAETALAALQRTKENAQLRYTYYTTRQFKNANENEHLSRLSSAKDFGIAQGVAEVLGSVLSAFPTIHTQLFASGFSIGGLQASNVCHAVSAGLGIKVGIDNIKGTMAVTTGGYERRRDDWGLQANTAQKEIQQIDQQILGAQIRIDIANRELSNHELQMENAQELDAYMRSKFSNVELYNWMIAQVSATYFQSYQLAYDMARRTEWCYKYELPMASFPTTGFVKFGYWDSLRKGLLAGEKLQYDVRKMEATYIEENFREFEMTKNISLAIFEPECLLEIKRSGTTTVTIPEELFDLDYPGHYLRRIKSVSISIPCIAGPYTTINCELRLMKSKYRKITTGLPYSETPNPWVSGSSYDPRFEYFNIESGAIATSSGQNDSGVFELNFRDERYLPFEGQGAISQWKISFPNEIRQFDYESINDVIIHIKYTSKADGVLKINAENSLMALFASLDNKILQRYFSLKHEFSNEWFAYSKAYVADNNSKMVLKVDTSNYPFYCKAKKITSRRISVMLNPKTKLTVAYKIRISYASAAGTTTLQIVLSPDSFFNSTEMIALDSFVINADVKTLQVSMVLNSSGAAVNMDTLLDDVFLITDYSLAAL